VRPFVIERVRVEAVTKVFGPTRALAGVTLELVAGTVTVLRGPNGSGKSTLLQILSTLMRPTSGSVRYGEVAAEGGGALLRARLGVLWHASLLYPDLTARENLELRARLYRVGEPRRAAERAIAQFDLGHFADGTCRTLSRGQLQRVALAAALLPRPRLLLLDEPTTGLDAGSVDVLCRALDEVRAGPRTIVALSTHDPAVAERVGDRIVTLERGAVAGVTER
jgi:heme exporter protein A